MKRLAGLIALTSLFALIGCLESSRSISPPDAEPQFRAANANSTTSDAFRPRPSTSVAASTSDPVLTPSAGEPAQLLAPESDPLEDATTLTALTAPEADPLEGDSSGADSVAALAAAMKRRPVEQVDVAPPKVVGGVWELTFDHLKFDIEKGAAFKREMLTHDIENLLGKKVRIRGYINPFGIFAQTGIRRFVFVRDNMECCFGPGAALYDCIVVDMVPPHSTDFTIRPIAVEGVLNLQVMEDPIDGSTMAIYHLDAVNAR